MRVLMLTPYLPYPLLSGGQIRTYNLLKNLSKNHEITLFALIKNESEREYIKELERYCSKVEVFKRPEKPFTLKTILRTGFSPFPFLVIRNLVDQVRDRVTQELTDHKYDLIHAETFYMMPNIPKTDIPVLLVEQTIEYLGYQSYANSSKNWLFKPFMFIDIFKIRFWEEYFWRTCDRLVVMSQEDKQFIQKSSAVTQSIEVVENGVDVEYFKKRPKKKSIGQVVLFVGTFNWLPNIEAVKYLMKKVWPRVYKDMPQAKLHIVGNAPTQEIRDIASKTEGVEVLGKVEDIRDAYADAMVLVAPVFSGKGTRYKVLEALATQTPVIGTPLAFEGLAINPGEQALIAEDEQGLAEHTIQVLSDDSLRRHLSSAGQEFVFKTYNWKMISEKLHQIYQSVAESKQTGA